MSSKGTWSERSWYDDVERRAKMLEQRPSAEYLARGNFADLYAYRKLVQQEPELSDTAKDLLRAVLAFVAQYAEPYECTVDHLLKVLELLDCPDHDEGVPAPVEDSGFGLLFREVIDGYSYEQDTAEWVRRIQPDTTSPVYKAWSTLLRGNTDCMIYDAAPVLMDFLERHAGRGLVPVGRDRLRVDVYSRKQKRPQAPLFESVGVDLVVMAFCDVLTLDVPSFHLLNYRVISKCARREVISPVV